MKKKQLLLMVLFSCICVLLVALFVAKPLLIKPSAKSSNGKLYIHGGGTGSVTGFAQLFHDKTKPIVVIPTADEGEHFGKSWPTLRSFYNAGFTDVTVLHTRDPNTANQDEFVEPLQKAAGVFIVGGRHPLKHRYDRRPS
ncbi:hypothetical protein [Paenibacillus solanacearum]|uniref:hypothetical protein n=1 Tax=Paenibacillus solanacearum TaxID=2048548 RepID=UPI001C408CA2|nr:hypothetical protein [Paenibacillus solanacearum]